MKKNNAWWLRGFAAALITIGNGHIIRQVMAKHRITMMDLRQANVPDVDQLARKSSRGSIHDSAKVMGQRGGIARAKSLTSEQRIAIARLGAAKRWGKS